MIIDALGDLCRLGLEKEGKVKEISFEMITSGGSVPNPLEEMESRRFQCLG